MTTERDVYLSFFRFTVTLRPGDAEYAKVIIRHIKKLREIGYAGFDLPIFPNDTRDHRAEVDSYAELKKTLDRAGLQDVAFPTTLASTRTFHPTSIYPSPPQAPLPYLHPRPD